MKQRFGWFTVILALAVSVSGAELKAQSVLTSHTRQAVLSGEAQPVGRLAATQQLQLDLVLPLRDEAGLEALLAGLYDPNSPYYRQFLTVEQFTERFGPTQTDYDAVVQFAQANGLKVVGGSRHGLDVQVTGRVAAIEQAFHVNLRTYQHPTENRTFYAPDAEPVANLNVPLWHITGLDNYALPKPRLVKRSDAAQVRANAGTVAPLTSEKPDATSGSGPSASFLGSDMRSAYYGGTALTGAGQHLGLLEYYGTNLADVTTYLKNSGQTNSVPINLISTDGTSTACNYTAAGGYCDDGEQTLDITQALGMAPGLASVDVYIGSSDTAILSAMTSHSPLPMTIGCSWGWGADPTVLDPYFKKMAAQGQSFLAASGDSSTWSSSNAAWPADDAYVTAVGGTDLVTTGAAGAWKSETAWADSGGGISSTQTAIPSWQQLAGVINSANKGSLVYRNGPDVAANANFTFYVCANQQGCTANEYGGTSFAAPMWAGYLALVNQQLAAKGNAAVGFINPTIYAAAITSNYSTYFHDITSGTSGSYSATTGFDLVTGWGSPNGQGLINLLAGSASAPSFTLSASPATLSLVQGTSGTSTLATAALNGFSSAVALTASGQPAGVTVSFSPSSIASPGTGSTKMTVAVASTVAAGSYTLTVTGAGSNVTKTTTVALTVTAAPSFTLTASAASLALPQGKSGTVTLTTAALNGFNSVVALTASGQPAGVTVGFSPASLAGSGTSTLTVTAASTAAAGTYTLTMTGTGGGVSKTATVALTVTPPPTFTLAVAPTSLTVAQGAKGTATVTTAALYGFSSSLTLAASGMPAGVSVSFSQVTGTAGASTLTATAAATAVAGTYPLTITATGGGITQTATLSLTVTPPPTFTLTPSSTALSVVQGKSGAVTLTTAALYGFNSAVTLSATGQPSGVVVSFSAASTTAANLTMTVAVGASVAPGNYTLTVTGTGGGITKTATVVLTVTGAPSFALTASPATLTVMQGNKGTVGLSTSIAYGFNSAIGFSVAGAPAGVTLSFSPASLTGAGSTVLTVAVASTTTPGSYPLTITGTGGGVTEAVSVTLTVTGAPSFTLTPSATSLTLVAGKLGTVSLSTAAQNGFNSAVTLTATGMPSGLTVSFSPATLAASGNSTMTVTAAATLATGNYSITVNASGGGVTKSTTVVVSVTAAANFAVTASPASLTIKRGTIGMTTIGATATGGFNAPISLSLALPAGIAAGFSQSAAGALELLFEPSPSMAAGTYTATMTATGGGITKSISVQLIVQ